MKIKASRQIFKLSGATGVIVSAALLLSSCKAITGRYRMYPGPARPREEVAVLRAVRDCQILSVDGKKVTHSWGMDTIELHLLPGPHVVTVNCGRRYPAASEMKLDFNAEPGRTYDVKQRVGTTPEGKAGWIAEIVEVSSVRTEW